jgi:hypothetical protein
MSLVKLLLMASIGLQINEAFFFDIDLDFHGTLQKGTSLPAQSGAYLKDSFRSSVLVPTFSEIAKQLKNGRRADIVTDALVGILGLLSVSGLIFVFARVREARAQMKKYIETQGKHQV